MIYRMAKDLAVRLRDRKWPVAIAYEGDLITRPSDSLRINIERDKESGDGFESAHGSKPNPQKLMTRLVGVRATLIAQSPKAGARVGDHQNLCDDLVDAFCTELRHWATEARAGEVPFTESRYLTEEERGQVNAPGAVYSLRFHISRGVTCVDFNRDARPEFDFVAGPLATRVSLDGQTFEPIGDH